MTQNVMRLVFTSDTHGQHRGLIVPECDVFFHCGDMSGRGEYSIYDDLVIWIEKNDPAANYVFIPGNHDVTFESDEETARSFFDRPNVRVLIDQGCVIDGLKVWGSPWTLRFYDWAFNADRGDQIQKHWNKIPQDIDVLLTHGPAYGYGDFIPGRRMSPFDAPGVTERNGGLHVGCSQLLARLTDVSPRIHAYGHIHEGAGVSTIIETGTLSVNAAFLDGRYRIARQPTVVDYDVTTRTAKVVPHSEAMKGK